MAIELVPSVSRGVKLRYKGIFDFQELWRLVHDWLESKSFEVTEPKAKHKMLTFGEELEAVLFGWRNVTDYYRFEMKVYAKYWDGQYVEVVQNGQKKKKVKARMFIIVSGKFILDYSDRFTKTKFSQALGNFMNKYVLRWQWDSVYGDQLNYKVLELQNVIKEFLDMEAKGSEYADMW